MYIKELHIDSFAALKDVTLDFSKGLNIIEGENESGKSSVAMFIKFMMYGLSGRTSDGEMSERKQPFMGQRQRRRIYDRCLPLGRIPH